jgi:hypothetical protein
MKVRIEVPARNDLVEGYEFYEGNEEGLVEFFWHVSTQTSSLSGFSVEFTERNTALCIGYYLVSFRSQFIIPLIRWKLS